VKDHLRLASLDLGTNSTRLLVADCDGEVTETVDRRMVITRLGEGVDESRQLSPVAVERTEAALTSFAEAMWALSPTGVAAAATSVLRDSLNGKKFLDYAERALGTRPRILRGDQEAHLSFLGAASDLEGLSEGSNGLVLVFDIGGGSTELILGTCPPMEGEEGPGLVLRSVDVGCVRMTERFLAATDPPSPLAIGRMESFLVSRLKPVVEELLAGREIALAVGLAGTITTLSGIQQGLAKYDTDRIHHSRLARAEVEELFRKLAAVPLGERKKVMGLEPGRADIITGGAAVLRVVMDLAGLEEIVVSEKDILDGLIIDLYRRTADNS